MSVWFVYVPDDGFKLYESKEAAKTALERAVEAYRERARCYEWETDVERICMGKVTHKVELLDVTTDVLPGLIECGMAKKGDRFGEAFVKKVS